MGAGAQGKEVVIHGNQIVIHSISERKNNEVNSKTPFPIYYLLFLWIPTPTPLWLMKDICGTESLDISFLVSFGLSIILYMWIVNDAKYTTAQLPTNRKLRICIILWWSGDCNMKNSGESHIRRSFDTHYFLLAQNFAN